MLKFVILVAYPYGEPVGERSISKKLPTITQDLSRRSIATISINGQAMKTLNPNFNTSISTNPQLLTSMTLISPFLYLKTNAKSQTSHIFIALI